MELTKDNGEAVITRDVRKLEAMMLAGFELCFTMLAEILENQKQGIVTDPLELEGMIMKQRHLFEKQMEHLRAERYFG